MIASFIGCARAGKAYCPLDISLPADRVGQIIETVQPPVVLSAVDFPEGLLSVTGKGMSSGEVRPGVHSSEGSAERKIPDTSTGTASEIVIPKILAGDELLAAAEQSPERALSRRKTICGETRSFISSSLPAARDSPKACRSHTAVSAALLNGQLTWEAPVRKKKVQGS